MKFKAGRELDTLVHEYFMGHEWAHEGYYDFGLMDEIDVPNYSTDHGAATEKVLERLTINYAIIVITFDCGTWYMALHGINEEKHFSEAATLPLAICLIALEAVGYEEGMSAGDKFIECPYQLNHVISPNDDRKIAEGADVKVYNNQKGKGYPAFEGRIDADGYARDRNGRHPFLRPGTWYFFVEKTGCIFDLLPIVVERSE